MDSVEDVRRCLPKVDIMTEEDPLKSPQHLFALRTLAILLGCSAMASGGKGATMQHRRRPHPRQGATLRRDGEQPTL